MEKRSGGISRLARRRFLKAVPAAVAAGLAAPSLAQQAQEQRISKDALDCAEKITGIDFSDADQQQALGGVNNNLASFERLRNINIPLDTEPAITFRPYLPGKKPKPGATPNGKVKVTTRRPGGATFVDRGPRVSPRRGAGGLVRKRDVSSTELTRMYLERLKKYGPKLNCVVTLTEELALAQAAQADKEIRSGRYRGPLHGIPWGAKDLLRDQGHPHHLGRHALSEPGLRLRRHRRRAAARCRCGARREAVARRAGAGRQLVPRPDEEPMERPRLERIVGRPRRGDGRRSGRLRDRHRDARLDHLAGVGEQRRRPAADLRPRQPLRRHGVELDDGQDRADVPLGRGLRAGVQRHLRARRPRRHRRGCAVRVEPGRPALEAAHRLREDRSSKTQPPDGAAAAGAGAAG